MEKSSVIEDLKNRKETIWLNPDLEEVQPNFKLNGKGFIHVKAANNRFMRFLKYMPLAFPETAYNMGLVESAILGIPDMQKWLNDRGANIQGQLMLKDDAHMPIAGSVKARGGLHEVLRITESVLQKRKLVMPTDDYTVIHHPEIRQVLSEYTIQVGSTGNLGISIGRTAARMGFHAVVHMSKDAKQWKKDLLRREGVEVVEYEGDYSQAVESGRAASAQDPMSFFVDDEKSEDLFFGYSTAALRVKRQLWKAGIEIDADLPLFLYIPCGVGGAPGGITFGFKELLGSHVHCFFVEPIEVPSFTLGMATGLGSQISVGEIGLGGETIADGLACARPSQLACDLTKPLVSGTCTVSDEHLKEYQDVMKQIEDVRLEPSACAGFKAVDQICRPDSPFADYIEKHNLKDKMANAIHIVWATGGGLMPEEE